jgi:hypothetical protein
LDEPFEKEKIMFKSSFVALLLLSSLTACREESDNQRNKNAPAIAEQVVANLDVASEKEKEPAAETSAPAEDEKPVVDAPGQPVAGEEKKEGESEEKKEGESEEKKEGESEEKKEGESEEKVQKPTEPASTEQEQCLARQVLQKAVTCS